MNIGDLVKWTVAWCVSKEYEYGNDVAYASMIGVITSIYRRDCWHVLWNDGETRRVHRSYLEEL